MLFNSIPFILFFLPIVLAVSWLIRAPQWRVIFWTIASYIFYASAGPWFVTLMLASTLVDFLLAQRIYAKVPLSQVLLNAHHRR